MSALPAPPLPPSPPVRPQGARRRGPRRSARSCFSSGSSRVKCAARSSSFHHSRVVTGLSEPIREEPSIWWQSKLENLTVGVDPLPLVGPVRVLRLLDVTGRVGDAHDPSRAPAYAPDYATAGKLCARTLHASYVGQERESCINKIRKIYENLLNISVYPLLTPRPLNGPFLVIQFHSLPFGKTEPALWINF